MDRWHLATLAFHFEFCQVVYYRRPSIIRSLLMGSCSFFSLCTSSSWASSVKHNTQHSAFDWYNGCCVQFVYLQLVFVLSLCWLNSFRMFFWLSPLYPVPRFIDRNWLAPLLVSWNSSTFSQFQSTFPPLSSPLSNQEVLFKRSTLSLCY